MADDDVDELAKLTARYEAGIAWLTAHDPVGSFYLWYKSGIAPHHPMPAQSEGRRADYADYHKALLIWLALDRKLLRLEKVATATEGSP